MSSDDSLDWKNYGVQSIINTVVNHKHLGNGSIILCHNGAKYTAQTLDDMINQMDHEGRQFVVGEEENIHQWINIVQNMEFLL